MGSEIIEVRLPDDEVMYVEVESSGGDVAFSRRRVSWKDLRADISRISHWVVESVRAGLPSPPTQMEVEFGVKLAAETSGLVGVLAKAGAEASVTVRLTWDHTARPAAGPVVPGQAAAPADGAGADAH